MWPLCQYGVLCRQRRPPHSPVVRHPSTVEQVATGIAALAAAIREQGLIHHAEALGRLSSINVRKVVWAVQELGLPSVQRTDAGGQFGIVREALPGPQSQRPGAADRDGTLASPCGVNAIMRYLCARHSLGNLCPEDLPTRFVAEQWMDWQQTTLNPRRA